MRKVRPKKSLGQHFLQDQNIAKKIVNSLTNHNNYRHLLEIGPGMGVLTTYLLESGKYQLHLVEIDRESVAFLKQNFDLGPQIIEADFLHLRLDQVLPGSMGVIGNFPYNISSQIFFRILEYKNQVEEVVGMLQKEVAKRLSAPPGNKEYGILSVLLQAYYDIDYLFSVPPQVFSPPPKVDSAVIRLRRNQVKQLLCNEKLFVKVVKQGFQTRRKTLRNALKAINLPGELSKQEIFSRRAEQLSVADFVELTQLIENEMK
ncbi:MAG: 16S rRNA (adenine(1518)-N(6)/adenine(1519)-N(6))-dimethyltransferase RsmA [Candidatus Cyclobacteriaceae bacterium M3_2C_046]